MYGRPLQQGSPGPRQGNGPVVRPATAAAKPRDARRIPPRWWSARAPDSRMRKTQSARSADRRALAPRRGQASWEAGAQRRTGGHLSHERIAFNSAVWLIPAHVGTRTACGGGWEPYCATRGVPGTPGHSISVHKPVRTAASVYCTGVMRRQSPDSWRICMRLTKLLTQKASQAELQGSLGPRSATVSSVAPRDDASRQSYSSSENVRQARTTPQGHASGYQRRMSHNGVGCCTGVGSGPICPGRDAALAVVTSTDGLMLGRFGPA